MAQGDVDRPEACPDRRRDRAFERDPVAPDRVERRRGERCARGLHHVDTRLLDVPLEADARSLEHATGRLGELGPGAVAGDQGDFDHAAEHSDRG